MAGEPGNPADSSVSPSGPGGRGGGTAWTPVLARLRDGLRTAVADPDFKAAMDKIETPIAFKQGAEFQAFFDADARRLAEGVRRVGKVEDKK